jgi:hypothetical protein
MQVVYPVQYQGNGVLMRALQLREIEQVAGGFEVSIDLPGINILLEEEDFSNAYNWAVDQMTDFF